MKRKIIEIDPELCNGCGNCIPNCPEGALQMIDGKARLVSEIYCDGLGACLGKCPQDAITVEEREAAEFDEEAVKLFNELQAPTKEALPCGCPGSAVREFTGHSASTQEAEPTFQPSTLGHWPVQLTLVPERAPFLQGADVLLAADCAAYAYGGFHSDFLMNHALLIACPKLDDAEAHQEKLNRLVTNSGLKSLTVIRMEVPCCSALVFVAKRAIQSSGKHIPFKEITIGVRGDIK